MARIKRIDFKKLKNTFNEMDNDTGMLGLSLSEELCFMEKTLKELKKEIEKGVVTEMSQGKYSIERANPALVQYNSMIKNYQSTVKQVNDLLPKNNIDDFDNFDDDDL